jgi:hypothetical protein
MIKGEVLSRIAEVSKGLRSVDGGLDCPRVARRNLFKRDSREAVPERLSRGESVTGEF